MELPRGIKLATPEETDLFFADKSVAVVGNARFEEALGEQIDACDIVVRFNNFELRGYSELLGHRLDVWSIFHGFAGVPKQIAAHRLQRSQSLFWQVPHATSPQDTAIVRKHLAGKPVFSCYDKTVLERPSGVVPSSGLQVLHRILQTPFRRLFVCGFRHFIPDREGYQHMQQDHPRISSQHCASYEQQTFTQLTDREDVEVFQHGP